MSLQFTKNHIQRTCKKSYRDYHRYKPDLQKDFNGRCAYCDLLDSWLVPLPYQIDHFIPRKAFTDANRMDLETDYNNLMYACPVCNRLKKDQFAGRISSDKIENSLFFNPVEEDMNKYFYRDDEGRILSDDEKGIDIIRRLQLYRPTKQMGWYLDELRMVYDRLCSKRDREENPNKKEMLDHVCLKVSDSLRRQSDQFRFAYMDKK